MPYEEKLLNELQRQANRIRQEVIRMTHAAGSGHPAGSLSEADILSALYFHFMQIDPKNPAWPDRDRFILSKGHACPGLYAALALRGYFPMEKLATLRRIDSILQGHPDMTKTPGVEMSAGPLGNGMSAGAGMALGARITGRDFRVFVLIGDGDAQEGCTWEASMFAGFQQLANLVCIYDYNRSQVDGPTCEILDLEPVADKWRAFNWEVREIDGHDIEQILDALAWAAQQRERPALIIAHTIKGKGVSFMTENPAAWHGKAPNKELAERALKELSQEALA
ncbi:MAG TPA: transketolase [Chloroflexi bacterium]|nr:transketolase [Chloroflexota bacterium]